MAQAKPKKNEKNFEQSMARLDEIVSLLENGSAPLEESLSLFEEGVGLVKDCTALLDRAEAQIQILSAGASGEAVLSAPPQNNSEKRSPYGKRTQSNHGTLYRRV